jgi:hypothetical protein
MNHHSRTNVIAILLAFWSVLGLIGCAPSQTRQQPTPQTTEIDKTVNVSMTGYRLEVFDFSKGDSIAGEFSVKGQYPIGLVVVYYEDIRGSDKATMAKVLDLKVAKNGTFTFVAPVSKEYSFFFHSDSVVEPTNDVWGPGAVWGPKNLQAPLSGLNEEVSLHMTVHHD